MAKLLRKIRKKDYLLLDYGGSENLKSGNTEPDIFKGDLKLKLYDAEGRIHWEISYEIDRDDRNCKKTSTYMTQAENGPMERAHEYKLQSESFTETTQIYCGYLVSPYVPAGRKKKFFCRLEVNLDVDYDKKEAGVLAEINFYKSMIPRSKIRKEELSLQGTYLVWNQDLRDM